MHIADDVRLAAAGGLHSLFVKTDGSLWAMGVNHQFWGNTFGFGSRGPGTYTMQRYPVHITDDVRFVSAGWYHSLIIKSDSSLWSIGENQWGQLGDGTTVSKSEPVHIADNVIHAAAGHFHSLFVTADGSLWGMGGNLYGNLGDGTTTDRSSPVHIANQVTMAIAGDYHSLFIGEGGVLPTLPANEAENIDLHAVFQWNDYGSASGYDIQVAEDVSFESPVIDIQGHSNTQLAAEAPLDELTRYFWRVREIGDDGPGPWSPVWSFTTAAVTGNGTQQVYFDLTVGTERHYHDCAGLAGICLPMEGINGLATEIVIGEAEIDGKIWAEVAWAYTRDFWHEDPDAFVVYDTAFYRTDGPHLYKHTAGGDSLIFDFGFAKGDSLLRHFLPFIPGDLDLEYYLQSHYLYVVGELPSVVLFDTTIAFPDGLHRRIVWGDDTLRTQYGDYYPITDVSEFVDSLQTYMNLPTPRHFIKPFYYIEGMGVMKTPVNHRHMNMSGFKTSDGMEFGSMHEILVSIDGDPERPAVFTLHQNYPNPFNPSTIIRYTLNSRSTVELSIYDVTGRLVAVPINMEQGEGEYTYRFNASNLAGGVYIYVLRANGVLSQSRKMILLK